VRQSGMLGGRVIVLERGEWEWRGDNGQLVDVEEGVYTHS